MPPKPCLGLTPREHEILRLRAEGLTNKEVAHGLRIGQQTVKNHLSHALAKLGGGSVVTAINALGWVAAGTYEQYQDQMRRSHGSETA